MVERPLPNRPMQTAGRSLYRQNTRQEFARVGAFFALWSLTGLATVLISAMPQTFSEQSPAFNFELLMLGVPWVSMMPGIAMFALWNRPLLRGWTIASIPALVVGVVGGFYANPVVVLVVAAASSLPGLWFARKRLPFSFPRYLPGSCPACGYTREQLHSKLCPECGTDLTTGVPLE